MGTVVKKELLGGVVVVNNLVIANIKQYDWTAKQVFPCQDPSVADALWLPRSG